MPEAKINVCNSCFKISKISQNIDKVGNAINFALISNFEMMHLQISGVVHTRKPHDKA